MEATLKMPSSYVLMSEEEMEYVDGGAIRCNVLAGIIDIGIALATLGVAGLNNLASKAGKHALKKNWHKILPALTKVLGRFGAINTFLGMANNILNACNSSNYWLNFSSIGGVVAYGIDLFDSSRRNCIAFG